MSFSISKKINIFLTQFTSTYKKLVLFKATESPVKISSLNKILSRKLNSKKNKTLSVEL